MSGSTFVRHPTDCSKYIRCKDKQPFIVQQCPGILVFNAKIGICDQSYNFDCTTGLEITKKTTTPLSVISN